MGLKFLLLTLFVVLFATIGSIETQRQGSSRNNSSPHSSHRSGNPFNSPSAFKLWATVPPPRSTGNRFNSTSALRPWGTVPPPTTYTRIRHAPKNNATLYPSLSGLNESPLNGTAGNYLNGSAVQNATASGNTIPKLHQHGNSSYKGNDNDVLNNGTDYSIDPVYSGNATSEWYTTASPE